MDSIDLNKFTEKTIDEIPMGYCANSDTSLYFKACELTFHWIDRYLDILKNSPDYSNWIKEFGEKELIALLEKEFYSQLRIYAKAYIRRMVIKNMGKDFWKKKIKIKDPTIHEILDQVAEHNELFEYQKSISFIVLKILKGIFYQIYDIFARFQIALFRNKNKSPKVGVELSEGTDNQTQRSEIFWWDRNSPHPNQMVIILEREQKTIDIERLKTWKNAGAKIFIDSTKKTTSYFQALYKPKNLPYFHYGQCHSNYKYVYSILPSFRNSLKFWEFFFKTYNIKIHINNHEASLNSLIQKFSIKKIQGLTLMRQRSTYYLGYCSLAFLPAHIHLCWGDWDKTYQNDQRNRNDLIIPVGHIFGAKPITKNNRGDKKFKILVFDNGNGVNRPSDTSQLINMYKLLIEIADKNPMVNLVFKTKKSSAVPAEIDKNIQYQELVKQQRITFFTGPSTMLPYLIAKDFDLTVSIQISTASLEINISGQRAFHYNQAIRGYHPLEKKFLNHIVFDSLNSLEKGIIDVLNGNQTLGYLNVQSKDLDYYSDGKGPQRMSAIINFLLKIDLSIPKNVYQILMAKFPGSSEGLS